MKKIVTLFIFVCISINMCAQIKIDNNKKTIIDNLISGMTYPNISIDNDKNFYLVYTRKRHVAAPLLGVSATKIRRIIERYMFLNENL